MTIWVLHPSFTPQEEEQLQERTHLALPFDDLPDLSLITSQVECRHLLGTLHPDDPPESITRKTERVWKLYAGLQLEDIIAVPLKSRKEIALAEVTERYRYRVDSGADMHQVGVKWYARRVKLHGFGKHKALFDERGEKMREITDPEARVAIRDKLPHSYNRFAKWKWLLALFFILGLLSRFEHLLTPH